MQRRRPSITGSCRPLMAPRERFPARAVSSAHGNRKVTLTFPVRTRLAGPVIRLSTCLDPVAPWLMSSIAGPSVAGGRSTGSIGPQTPSTALPPGSHATPVDAAVAHLQQRPPRDRAEATGDCSTPGSLLPPRDPATLTVKGSASSDRSPAGFARDEHQTGATRPKPSRTTT